jgi:hypothetical protein
LEGKRLQPDLLAGSNPFSGGVFPVIKPVSVWVDG